MRKKIFTASVGIITILALIIFTYTLVHALFYAPDDEISVPTPENKSVGGEESVSLASQYPLRLMIPALHISAAVQYVGVNGKGNMATPNNFTDVAWYKYGPIPGSIGSAVVAGHVDNGLSLPGVFKHLDTIRVGDDVYILTKDNSKIHFMVSDIKSYPYKEAPADLIFNQHDTARLNLLTCVGDWVAKDKTYDHRLVVFTTRVP